MACSVAMITIFHNVSEPYSTILKHYIKDEPVFCLLILIFLDCIVGGDCTPSSSNTVLPLLQSCVIMPCLLGGYMRPPRHGVLMSIIEKKEMKCKSLFNRSLKNLTFVSMDDRHFNNTRQ